MRCVANKEDCTSFNYYPVENKCCLAGGNIGYGANLPNPNPDTGHITYDGTVEWEGEVKYKGEDWSEDY